MIVRLRRCWDKNWPELRCILRGGAPFIAAPCPRELTGAVPVFCYHRINAERFAADLAFLKRSGYTFLDADDLADHMTGARPAPGRSIVLTIDDGMRDLYTRAFPLLREFHAIAVAFIAPGLHGEHGDRRRARLCTWQELEEMHLSGLVDIQSHTLEHRLVTRWPFPCGIRDDAGWLDLRRRPPLRLRNDLLTARRTLERRLKKVVRHLAFPQYLGSAPGVRAALSCGYSAMWWGVLGGRATNAAGDPLTQIVRLSGDFVRRLPGEGREPLTTLLRHRLRGRGATGSPIAPPPATTIRPQDRKPSAPHAAVESA